MYCGRQKYKSGTLKTNVTFIPVRPAQLERALLDGIGDVIGFELIVTPERAREALLTNPIAYDVKQINAGPTRIARLRKKAATEGLDPNKWFGNVELAVARDVGQETVRYVSNIYKHYVAYKLTLDESSSKN
jgi:membrane-bound lytic murein transglycosylase MltF